MGLFVMRGANFDTETTNGPSSSFTWTVQTYGLDTKSSDAFFFWLFQGNTSEQGINLHQMISSFFHVADGSADATATSFVTSTTSPPDAPSNNPSSDTGLSIGAKAGIGVAVAMVCLVGAALAFFFIRRYRSRGQKNLNESKSSDGKSAYGTSGYGTSAYGTTTYVTSTYCSPSVAELGSESVSPKPVYKQPDYRPVPGDKDGHPTIAELGA
jgi:hypothetical protein